MDSMLQDIKNIDLYRRDGQDRRVSKWTNVTYSQFCRHKNNEEAATHKSIEHHTDYQKECSSHFKAPQHLLTKFRDVLNHISWCLTLFQFTDLYWDAVSFDQKTFTALQILILLKFHDHLSKLIVPAQVPTKIPWLLIGMVFLHSSQRHRFSAGVTAHRVYANSAMKISHTIAADLIPAITHLASDVTSILFRWKTSPTQRCSVFCADATLIYFRNVSKVLSINNNYTHKIN